MKRNLRNILGMMLMLCMTAAAQSKGKSAKAEPPKADDATVDVATVLDRNFSGMEKEFVPAAEAMPEEKFSFAPSPSMGEFKDVRTFEQEVRHVAAVNYMLAAALLGEKPPVDVQGQSGPESVKGKDAVIKYLKDSMAYTHKALATVNAGNVVERIPGPFGPQKMSRLGMATLVTSHSFDHYGQMVEYLRMNGIIPPASRPQ